MSDTALVLISAAVAVSITELLSGPLLLRSFINKWATAHWMLAGLTHWRVDKDTWSQRLRIFLNPTPKLTTLCEQIGAQLQLADNPHTSKRVSIDAELFQVATGGGQSALYRLESDQMVAQINAAAEAVLDQPSKRPLLLITFAKLTRDEAQGPPSAVGPIAASKFLKLDSTIAAPEIGSRVAEARHELTLRVQRRLDDLQITTRTHQHVLHQTLHVLTAIGAASVLTMAQRAAVIDLEVLALGGAGGFIAPLIARLLKRGAV
jgi:hypothetical protein